MNTITKTNTEFNKWSTNEYKDSMAQLIIDIGYLLGENDGGYGEYTSFKDEYNVDLLRQAKEKQIQDMENLMAFMEEMKEKHQRALQVIDERIAETEKTKKKYVLVVRKGVYDGRTTLRYIVAKISEDGQILADEKVGPQFLYSERKEFMEYVKNAQEEFNIKELYTYDLKVNKNIESLFENVFNYKSAFEAKQAVPAFEQGSWLR